MLASEVIIANTFAGEDTIKSNSLFLIAWQHNRSRGIQMLYYTLRFIKSTKARAPFEISVYNFINWGILSSVLLN